MYYTVIRDTREKARKGWWWQEGPSCAGTVEQTLKTGDYTLEDYEDILSIERKGKLTEWAENITQARFFRELKRFDSFRFAFILLEFDIDDIVNYPKGTAIPMKMWSKLKIGGSFIMKRTLEISMLYKPKVIFCGKHGKEVASSIFKRVVEIIKDEQTDNPTKPGR